MKTVSWALFFVCLGLTACSRGQAARPEDFSLILEWDTGALPPPYHYSYIISISPDFSGAFSFQPGYAPDNSGDLWETTFDLQNSDMDALYETLAEKGVFRSKWSTGQPLLGGQGTSLMINVGKEKYVIPSVSILARQEREKVEEVIEIIRGYVPKPIWDEMDVRRAEFEAGFEY